MKPRLSAALAAVLAVWIWALAWLYDGMPPWSAWQIFGFPVMAFCFCTGFRAMGPPEPLRVREGVWLGVLLSLLVTSWCVDLGLIPSLSGPFETGLEGLRLWPFQAVLAFVAGLSLGRTLRRDLRVAEALILVLLAAGIAWGGAYLLRGMQGVPDDALPLIRLDRGADPSGLRPLSNFRMRPGPFRAPVLQGVIRNDNPFPVWGVEMEIRLEGMEAPERILLREDIPAHGVAPLFWARRFTVEQMGPNPSWKLVTVGARRHWGGGSPRVTGRLTGSQGPLQSRLP